MRDYLSYASEIQEMEKLLKFYRYELMEFFINKFAALMLGS
jgi:hypothetical protein